MMRAMAKGAIFDMDGLLTDTEKLGQEAWRTIAEREGVVLDDAFTSGTAGTAGKREREVVARYFPGRDLEPFFREVHAYILSQERKSVSLKPGAAEIVGWLKENGVKTAIASSSSMDMIRLCLAPSGLLSQFDAVISGYAIAHPKPAPDVFLTASRALGLAPGDCWVFEDSYNGIKAAFSAGCQPVMVPDLVPPDEEMKEKAKIYPTLNAALSAIRSGRL